MIRRWCCFIIVLALCASMCVEALAYTGVSDWAAAEVEAADSLGIIPASLEDQPLNGAMTRLDMCHMAVNAFEKLTDTSLYPAKINHFSDTRDADVCVAYELGLVSGYPDGTFQPAKRISRQEFSKITDNLLGILGWTEDGQTLSAFSDEARIADWARAAAARMIRLKIVTGGTDGRLNPEGSASYEQACAMFYRAYSLLAADRTTGFAGAAEPVGDEAVEYIDLSPWAADIVTELGMMQVLPDSAASSSMTGPISRGDMCEMAIRLYTALGNDQPEIMEPAFSDTNRLEISQASELGIVNGYPDGTFHPDAPLTRQQFFQITNNLLKACGCEAPSDSEFLAQAYTDAAQIADWAQAGIAVLNRMDIMHGDTHGKVTPTADTTCEQAIAMFMRTLDQVGDWYEAHPLDKIDGPLTSPNVALQVVELARSFVGYPYVWAGADPSVGFDCSGLVYYVYKQFGYNLYRAGDGMANNGIAVSESDMQPGDIIIFANRSTGSIQHVGLYIGDGMMVHAQSSRTGVVISRYDYDTNKFIYTIRRIIY